MILVYLLATLFVIGQCCEPIHEPLCQSGVPYNLTVFPNLVGHLFQGGAAVALQNIRSLIDRQCSPNIREFLCRVYIPECSTSGQPVLPSYAMCQEAYEGCNVLLNNLGVSWSFSLNCSRFEVSTINSVKKLVQDKSAFWFGSGVTTLCHPEHTTLACKINPRPGQADSIVSRLSGLDISRVDKSLEIHYSNGNGQFQSCNNEYSLPSGSFQVDPLSPTVHYPWEVRNLPRVIWPATSSHFYTLIVYDPGFMYVHGVFVNIPGNNITASDMVVKYFGPMNPTEVVNPYVFLLYEQRRHIQITNYLMQSLNMDPMSTVHNEGDFIGPVAISIVRVKEDPFSIETLKSTNVVNNCPSLVTEALHKESRPFLPRNTILEMSVDVTYTPASISFTSCCKNYVYRETSFQLNPLGNVTVKTAHVRSTAVPSVTLTKRDAFPAATNFSENEIYTLIMVDPDVASPSSGNPSRPLIHWMVLNIRNGTVHEGLTVREYRGPQPPNGVHTYYFLVYKQTSVINPNVLSNYTASTCARCLFDINRFTSDEGLKLTGAAWMLAKDDEYVRHLHIDENTHDQATECVHEPQYLKSCSHGDLIPEIIG